MKKLLVLILVLGIATVSFAVDKLSIRKFGGLNTRTNSFELQDSESPDMSNFVLDEAGTLTRRGLFQRYNATSAGNITFTNLYKFYTSADAGYMFLSGGTKLYRATGGTITDVSNATSTITSNSQWAFESFTDGTNELCFAANNDCVLQSSSGTTNFANEAAPATNCNILKKHKSRLWAAGSRTYPYRIYYSSISDGDDWTTTGGSMDLGAYEKIMALEVLSDTLFIFTRTSVYAVLGDTPQEFAIQKTRSTVGTHAFKSVVVGNKLIYFLNKAGVFVFNGDESVNISETIQPTIDAISNTYIGNSACLFDNRGRFWIAYTSTNGSYNDKILVYDTVLKQWYPIDNVNFSAFFKAEGAIDKGDMYATCSNPVGDLWKLQTSTSTESIVHSTQTQLLTGVTSNTVVGAKPVVEIFGGYDNYTKLLAHFDGTNGGTYTPAETGQVITYVGTAQLSTADKKFGSASLLLDGTNDYCTVPDSSDWAFGTGNFTIDFWFKRVSVGTLTQYILGQISAAGNEDWDVSIQTGDILRFFIKDSLGANHSCTGVITITDTTTWHHYAVIRDGDTITQYIDGVADGTADVTGLTMKDSAVTVLGIGNGGEYTLDLEMNGYMDEVRISKGIARQAFPYPESYRFPISNGSLTSDNLQINSAGQASLGQISWQEYLYSNTDIQFTTRTGATDDTVYYQGWQTWVSSSTVVSPVTNATAWLVTGTITALAPSPQARNVLYYETDDNVSPNSVKFGVSGAVSTNAYATTTIPIKDLTNYKFVGYWLKSAVTGNAVVLDMINTTGNTVGYTTANTVTSDWEYHYWAISPYTDLKDIYKLKFTYKGDGSGNIYLGDIYAYDFLDNDETITSTPNDWIQYKAILGSNDANYTPRLLLAAGYVIKLSYSSSAGASETSLNSYWTSKPMDGGDSSKNKLWQYLSFQLESQNPTTGHTVQLYYKTDDGRQSGTLSKTVDVTGRTVNLKFYLPTGTYGRNFKFKFIDDALNDELKIKNAEVFVLPEGNS